MEQLVGIFGIWTWWVLAGVLFAVELLLPGIFFLWFGLAAVAVGFLNLILPFQGQMQIAIFAVLSAVFLLAARPWLLKRQAFESEQPHLNRRMYGYVGRRVFLEEPIRNGQGKIRIDDAQWIVNGLDQASGTWVKIVGVDGHNLVVEPSSPPDSAVRQATS